MGQRSSLRRPCRDHEREWQGRCIDKGLQDAWLDQLSDLKAFQLISICEGHAAAAPESHGTSPHIKVRMRESLLSGLSSRWDSNKSAVMEAVANLFQTGDTYVNLELKMRLRASTGRLNYQETLVARIYRRRPDRQPLSEDDRQAWFDETVSCVQELDRVMISLWTT